MKKTSKICISVLLICLMLINCCPVFADGEAHWADESKNYVIEHGYWKETDSFSPDKTVTRGQLAGLMANVMGAKITDKYGEFSDVPAEHLYSKEISAIHNCGIMQGDNGQFRPDDGLTREELATILNRAYVLMGEEINATILKSRFVDYDEISQWAVESVYNCSEGGIMRGVSNKFFSPKGKVTCAEAATVVQRLDGVRGRKELNFSSRLVSANDNIKDRFPLLQKANGVHNARGFSGFSVLARFDSAPSEIYVARTATSKTLSTPWDPMTIVRVSDPDGNLIAYYDFSDMEVGDRREAIIMLPQGGKSGIYTVSFMNAAHKDILEIGLPDTKYWGVRGDMGFNFSETTPNPGYVYAQKTAKFAYIGMSLAQQVSLATLDGTVIAGSSPVNRPTSKHDLYYEGIAPDTVFQLNTPENYAGGIIIDGITGLICPTPEAAENLKGGWVEESGIVTQGPLQARARAEALRLYETKELDVKPIGKPDEIPDVIYNPKAEAQLFGAYGVISKIQSVCERQSLNPDSPHFGSCWPLADDKSYQSLNGHVSSDNLFPVGAIAVALPLQLNYFYGSEALTTRVALSLLSVVTGLSESGIIRSSYNMYDSYDPSLQGMFINDYFVETYMIIKNYLDPQTRDIIEEGIRLTCDKNGDNMGHGPTNQGLFTPINNARMWGHTGVSYYHEAFKRQLDAICETTWPSFGYNETGYFVESGGMDASYAYMNLEEFSTMYLEYKKTPYDEETMALLKETLEDSLEFESFWCTPQAVTGEVWGPNSYTSRTNTIFGNGGQIYYEKIWHEFPVAALRHKVPNPVVDENFHRGYPHQINTDEQAMQQIRHYWDEYDKYFKLSDNRGGCYIWTWDSYEAFNADEYCEPAANLPCEEEGTKIWDDRYGFIAFKHKGIYSYCLYEVNCEQETTNNYCFLGGGPLVVWSENLGNTLVSRKNLNYNNISGENDIIGSSVFGRIGNQFFFSGKEGNRGLQWKATQPNTLTWLEEGKKFEIKGTVPKSEKTVSWIYDLTDTGVDLTVSISPYLAGEEFWINLPFQNIPGYDRKIKENGFTIVNTVEGAGGSIDYSWDEPYETKWLPTEPGSSIDRFRMKIPSGGSVTIHMTANAQ